MLWICRAGVNARHYDKFIQSSRIYLAWEGYRFDLSSFDNPAELREIVAAEKGTDNRTSISNWCGQITSFSKTMKIGDYVLIPSAGSRTYCLAQITGEYSYNADDTDGLYHSRSIQIIKHDIPRNIFSQQIIYSLGAYRTLFKAKEPNEVMKEIHEWSNKQ